MWGPPLEISGLAGGRNCGHASGATQPFAGALSTDEIQHLRKLRLERSRESLSRS